MNNKSQVIIVPLTKDKTQVLDDALSIFLEAFRNETFTGAWLDLGHNKQQKLYKRACYTRFNLYVEAGHHMFVAMEDNQTIGLLVIKSPHVSISLKKSLFKMLPDIAPLIPYALRHTIPLAGAAKPPNDIPKPFYTLEALAVHPSHQGKGVGGLLLKKAEEYCIADKTARGIYLLTGDEKNRKIYEKHEYRVLKTKTNKLLTAYHMFFYFPENLALLSKK